MTKFPIDLGPLVSDPYSAPLAEALKRATAEPPKTAKAACHGAGLQIRLGDLTGARATLQAALERFPESWLLWKFEALVNLEERGPKAAAAIETAVAAYWRVAELPDTVRVRTDLLLSMGICLGPCGESGRRAGRLPPSH